MIAAYILYAHATSQVPVLCGQCNLLNLRYSWRYPQNETSLTRDFPNFTWYSYLIPGHRTTPLPKLEVSSHNICFKSLRFPFSDRILGICPKRHDNCRKGPKVHEDGVTLLFIDCGLLGAFDSSTHAQWKGKLPAHRNLQENRKCQR